MFDLGPAAQEMSWLVAGVRDDQLGRPTPCTDWTITDLLAHVVQFTAVFTANARRQEPRPPDELMDDWRDALPRDLAELAHAWRKESAWHGRVRRGCRDGRVGQRRRRIEELTTHGWDLARATGQHLDVDDAQLDKVDRFLRDLRTADRLRSGPVWSAGRRNRVVDPGSAHHRPHRP